MTAEFHFTIKIEKKHTYIIAGLLILLISVLSIPHVKALTQQQVIAQSPAYHLLKDIYTVISGEYIPIATPSGKINGSLIEGVNCTLDCIVESKEEMQYSVDYAYLNVSCPEGYVITGCGGYCDPSYGSHNPVTDTYGHHPHPSGKVCETFCYPNADVADIYIFVRAICCKITCSK